MLDDLGGPAGEGFDPGLELLVLPADLDLPEPLGFPGAAQQGQAAFFCFVFPGGCENLRIQHHHVAALAVEGNDTLIDADHIGSHAHAFGPMGPQGIQQIPGYGKILRACGGRFSGQKDGVMDDGTDHKNLPFAMNKNRRQILPPNKYSISEKMGCCQWKDGENDWNLRFLQGVNVEFVQQSGLKIREKYGIL